MANEIYVNSYWGNPTTTWGEIYYDYEIFKKYDSRVSLDGGTVEAVGCLISKGLKIIK